MQDLKTYYVYIVEGSDTIYYVGITNDIERRLIEHNAGIDRAAFTYSRRPVKLKYLAEFQFVNQALEFEKQIKGWSRKKKQALIESDWKKIIEISNEKNNRKKNEALKRDSTNQIV